MKFSPYSWGAALRLGVMAVAFYLQMAWYLKAAPRLWWLRHRGRAAEADRIVERIGMWWGAEVLRRVGCRVEVAGREHVPLTGAVVVMANHQGQYDIPLLMSNLGRLMGFVAKRQLFRVPVLSYWMRQIHCVALDRDNARSSGAVYAELATRLRRSGRGFIVFPEGTRTRDPEGRIGPFRQGSLRLAMQGGLPVLPVTIEGTRFLNQPSALQRTRHGGRLIRVHIHPVRYPDPNGSAPERRRFMEELRETIAAQWEALRLTWPAGEGEVHARAEADGPPPDRPPVT